MVPSIQVRNLWQYGRTSNSNLNSRAMKRTFFDEKNAVCRHCWALEEQQCRRATAKLCSALLILTQTSNSWTRTKHETRKFERMRRPCSEHGKCRSALIMEVIAFVLDDATIHGIMGHSLTLHEIWDGKKYVFTCKISCNVMKKPSCQRWDMKTLLTWVHGRQCSMPAIWHSWCWKTHELSCNKPCRINSLQIREQTMYHYQDNLQLTRQQRAEISFPWSGPASIPENSPWCIDQIRHT